MAATGQWEVDPETRSKLLAIQKQPGNSLCCDCNSPSPQWASPKFGIFICLACAGEHRGLGVHISFVRSVTMDAFKSGEIERMRLGGNNAWKQFWAENSNAREKELPWTQEAVPQRYPGFVGEQYKESLTCQVEGREFKLGERSEKEPSPAVGGAASVGSGSRSGTPLSGRRDAPRTDQPGGRVKVDDKYFAKLGADNAARSADLPPSQGGNKGFGWFASTVTKTAKTVNEGYIQPTASKLAESDFGKQASLHAATVARQAQESARSANQGFMRFVEGDGAQGGSRTAPLDESKKTFWDDFASIGETKRENSGGGSTIGTAAMGKGRKKEDDWDW
ncbi:related to ADP-ribosylation factor GTPase-activating protein [Cephalotrichum gorgonifer]|uniref:Related to ADP-ribosylation factor GTPase-activating protein n=1 Tax=Cephalotrichum gorgonifer TaxID=2041049 RepID=A0AAE8MR79_9PEZI|nr:related to ADP-ribosylation factor GTPase-activating protein [Cephalotrichum gorgonifer]